MPLLVPPACTGATPPPGPGRFATGGPRGCKFAPAPRPATPGCVTPPLPTLNRLERPLSCGEAFPLPRPDSVACVCCCCCCCCCLFRFALRFCARLISTIRSPNENILCLAASSATCARFHHSWCATGQTSVSRTAVQHHNQLKPTSYNLTSTASNVMNPNPLDRECVSLSTTYLHAGGQSGLRPDTYHRAERLDFQLTKTALMTRPLKT